MLRVDKESGAPLIRCNYCDKPVKDVHEAVYGYRPAFAGDPRERSTGFVVHLHQRCAGHHARAHGPTNSWTFKPLTELIDGLAALAH